MRSFLCDFRLAFRTAPPAQPVIKVMNTIFPQSSFRHGLFAGLALVALAGCGGSSGGVSTSAADDGPTTSSPTISLSASPTLVNAGGSTVVTWSSTNAASCQASGGWSGGKDTSGSETVGPLQQNTTLSLSCSGAGGSSIRSVQIQVSEGNGASVSLSANPENVAPGGTTTLSWSSLEATSCTASGDWAGDRDLTDSEVVGPLNADASYQLTCDGPSGSAVSMVTVRVLDKTVRWQPPTQNVDGTPLTDLAGFIVYWGSTSRNYTGSQPINSATATEWEVTLGEGEYYFALTALDSDDNESGYSNEILRLIP
jgi:hypothetical protein